MRSSKMGFEVSSEAPRKLRPRKTRTPKNIENSAIITTTDVHDVELDDSTQTPVDQFAEPTDADISNGIQTKS
jgi:hypothetical protein